MNPKRPAETSSLDQNKTTKITSSYGFSFYVPPETQPCKHIEHGTMKSFNLRSKTQARGCDTCRGIIKIPFEVYFGCIICDFDLCRGCYWDAVDGTTTKKIIKKNVVKKEVYTVKCHKCETRVKPNSEDKRCQMITGHDGCCTRYCNAIGCEDHEIVKDICEKHKNFTGDEPIEVSGGFLGGVHTTTAKKRGWKPTK